jgi:MscS family membrane protein
MVGGAPLADWALLLGLAAASYAVLRLAATLVLVIAAGWCAASGKSVYRFIQVGLAAQPVPVGHAVLHLG